MKRISAYRVSWIVVSLLLICHGNLRVAHADIMFGIPENLGPVINRGTSEAEPSIAADGLSLYFSQGTAGVYYGIYVATRPTREADWTAPTKLGAQIHGPDYNGGQHISADGLTLYYSPMLAGEYGGPGDLWTTKRATHDDPWGPAENMGPVVNSTAEEWAPSTTADELLLCFMSSRPGGRGEMDLWMTTRPTKADDWLPPANLGAAVNSSSFDGHPSITSDGLAIFFQSNRPGGSGGYDLWVSTRQTVHAPWTEARNLGPLINSPSMDGEPSVSADGSRLYFSSGRAGGYGSGDLWQVPIIPIIDFNCDGNVGIKDLLKLIESWGQDDLAVDIAPLPFGDGHVDALDLETLMDAWGQEVSDPTLLAHWALDETQGDIAFDSAHICDAVLLGDPVWVPDGGQVAGAIQLDGVDDYAVTPSIVNAADGPFSVLAWIRGGSPGQVLMSQDTGANWLLAGPTDGCLMTELQSTQGRIPGRPLDSQAVISDGQWHRVALTWDGRNRTLYVDDTPVAQDTQSDLGNCSGGLNIGCGTGAAPGTFFEGLIDDVRIYNRAIRP